MAAEKTPVLGLSKGVLAAYGIFFVLSLAVYHFVANGEFSAILTMSVMFQTLSFTLLALNVFAKGSTKGISARSLTMEALSFVFRLSSTTWLNGYLPVDASGDMVFQACDVCSLFIVLWLLHRVLVADRKNYNEEADSLSIVPIVLVCLVLAAMLHADMNARPLFDTLWMTGLFVGVMAVLPQLWLITHTGGVIESTMSHFIAMLAVSRLLSGSFMWHARFDITCEEWITGVNHAVLAILSAHAFHLLLLGDFGYFYMKAVMKKGLNAQIELPSFVDTV